MPKHRSARLTVKARQLAAEKGISYSAALAELTGRSAAPTPGPAVSAPEGSCPEQIVDVQNRTWILPEDGTYCLFDATCSMPRPLPDARLAELAVEPGFPGLTLEQIAAIVEHLPLELDHYRRVPALYAEMPRRAVREALAHVSFPEATPERITAIIDRIVTETTTDETGNQVARFDIGRGLLTARRPLAEIERHFGPWRPVRPMSASDRRQLRAAFELAGRTLVSSVASALSQVHREACARPGPWNRSLSAAIAYSRRTLSAGTEGTPRAKLISEVIDLGDELNRSLPGTDGEAGPPEGKPEEAGVHLQARNLIAAVLRRWTTSSTSYTEIPALAEVVADIADEQHGPDGWSQITGPQLQPGGTASSYLASCYDLLYHRSAYYDRYYTRRQRLAW